MAQTKSFKCDVCGATKQDSNHWVLVTGDLHPKFLRWSNAAAARTQFKHLCGLTCSLKLLSQAIEAWSKPEESGAK
jgi:hypothetical protein